MTNIKVKVGDWEIGLRQGHLQPMFHLSINDHLVYYLTPTQAKDLLEALQKAGKEYRW